MSEVSGQPARIWLWLVGIALGSAASLAAFRVSGGIPGVRGQPGRISGLGWYSRGPRPAWPHFGLPARTFYRLIQRAGQDSDLRPTDSKDSALAHDTEK